MFGTRGRATLFFLLCSLTAVAQEAELHGLITDTEGTPLVGATVRVNGSVIGTTSDVDGKYQLEVPPGLLRVVYTYLGYENFDTIVRIRPEQRELRVDIALSEEFSELPELIVVGNRASGQAQALRIQQSAVAAQTIVHSETFNQYPDITMAETAARLPGVSIIRNNQGGEIVQVRGLPEQYTAVHLNGQRLPTVQPEADQGGSLDLIQSNLVDEVRVIKTRTADADGDAIAGSVDFRIRQPENKFELLAQGAVGNNFGFDQNPGQTTGITQLAGVLNSEVADEKVYALLGGSYFRQNRGSRTLRYDYLDPQDPARLTTANPFDEDRTTTRRGFVGAVELRPSIYNRLRLSYTSSEVSEEIIRRGMLAHNNFNGSTFSNRETSAWEQVRNLQLVTLEVENNFPRTRLDYQLSFSKTSEDQENLRRDFLFSGGGTPFTQDYLETALPDSDFPAGNPPPVNSRQKTVKLDEDVAIGSLNVTRFLNQNKTQFLRIGGRYRSKDREYGQFRAQQAAAFDPPTGVFPEPSREQFAENPPDEELEGNDYRLKQRISAAYLMYVANFTSRLSASAGVRYEHIRVETFPTMTQDSTRFTDDILLPSFNLTYRVRRDRQIRLGVARAVGYPNYANYVDFLRLPLFNVDQFSRGNPDIQRTTATNFDLTFERYGRRDGLISVGLYGKFLDNPTVRITEPSFDVTRFTYNTQVVNTEEAELYGFELAVYQSLGFLNPNLRYFNLNGTYNFNALSAQSSDLIFDSFTLPQAPRQTANLAIVYNNPATGKKERKLSLTLAANYRDRIFDRVYNGEPLYRNSLVSLDLAADYEVIKNISLYARVNNLTDHRYEEWFGEPNDDGARLRSRVNYGTWGVIGVRFQPDPTARRADGSPE